MAYESGTATGVADLLDKLVLFINSNGWTQDAYTTEGTGKRYHGHRSGQYVNLRSFIVETPNSGINGFGFTNITSIAFNVGTGYSGAASWFAQPGVSFQTSQSKYDVAGMKIPNTAFPSYHFFAHNSGNNILALVEWKTGYFNWIGFGLLDKKGIYTGGDYFFGCSSGVNQITDGAWSSGTGVHHTAFCFFGNGGGNGATQQGFAKADFDGENRWHASFNGGNYDTHRRVNIDNLQPFNKFANCQPNTLNELEVFQPMVVEAFRDTSVNYNTTSGRSVIGEIPKTFFVNLAGFSNKQQVTIGSTNYRVFPFTSRDTLVATAGVQATTWGNGDWGFAVEE